MLAAILEDCVLQFLEVPDCRMRASCELIGEPCVFQWLERGLRRKGAVRNVILFSFFFVSLGLAQEPVLETIPSGVSVEVPAETKDGAIAKRLALIFSEIEELSDLEAKVSNGVVTLRGTTPSSDAKREAIALTLGADGVVFVKNQIEDEVEVKARLAPAREKAVELWQKTVRRLPIFAVALVCVIFAWLIGSWFGNRRKWYRRLGLNELSAALLGRVLKLVSLGLGIFVALEILDATAMAAGVLGVAGVAGVALGFAFRNIIGNYLAGILLSLRNPFSTGDAVEIGEHSGKVLRLTSRDTVLMTYDGNHLRIPNSHIITSALTNLSRNPYRRFDFAIGVSTDLDMVEVRNLGIEALEKIPSVLSDPAPHILIEELGDSTVNMRFYGWVDQRESDFAKTKSESIRLVKDFFDEAEIEMPEPIYRVHLHQAGELQAPSRKTKPSRDTTASDVSVDETIDRQVAAIREADDEENLLNPKT